MSFIISTQAEVLKTKRTASFWLSIIAAGFLPLIFLLVYFFNPDDTRSFLGEKPWIGHFMFGWQILNSFLFPMYVILMCTLIPQIEYKNNAWKQVFASPQTIGNIFFSKFLTVHLMIFFFYILFNLFMILAGVITSLINPKFLFLDQSIDWSNLLKLNLKTYISILGISAIQFWLSLKFKNFIGPVGIGLGLIILSIIAMNFEWSHIYKIPFAHPALTLRSMMKPEGPFLENHEINSIICFVLFAVIGLLDLRLRKEKG